MALLVPTRTLALRAMVAVIIGSIFMGIFSVYEIPL